jgi:hypothetical protein
LFAGQRYFFSLKKSNSIFRAKKNRENIRSSCRTFKNGWKVARGQMKKRILEFLVSKILFFEAIQFIQEN